MRKAEYDLDESQVRPYFELDRVLRDGVFFAANKLYGITFKERKDLPVYHPDVRVFEVFDADGKSLALYYGDYFSRANKSGGAWCDSFVDQSRLLGTKPVVVNVLNFTKPARRPARAPLLRRRDRALPRVRPRPPRDVPERHATRRSPRRPRDFVEFPSQFNEHWALEPTVLANYAKHYKTGEPMPDGARRRRSRRRRRSTRATRRRSTSPRRCSTWPGTRCRPTRRCRT